MFTKFISLSIVSTAFVATACVMEPPDATESDEDTLASIEQGVISTGRLSIATCDSLGNQCLLPYLRLVENCQERAMTEAALKKCDDILLDGFIKCRAITLNCVGPR